MKFFICALLLLGTFSSALEASANEIVIDKPTKNIDEIRWCYDLELISNSVASAKSDFEELHHERQCPGCSIDSSMISDQLNWIMQTLVNARLSLHYFQNSDPNGDAALKAEQRLMSETDKFKMNSSDAIKVLDAKVPTSIRQIESLVSHLQAKNPRCPALLKEANGRAN